MELNLWQVTKKYGDKTVCDHITMNLRAGVYGLLGANGAGKTTLIRMICGILNLTQGKIDLNGIDIKEEAYRNNLGYLPQEFGYYPEFSAQDYMMYIATLKGLPKSKAVVKTKELLELVSLQKEAKKKIKTFSGGMKQRLGIAQSLLNDPQILILDEPTAGLDPKERVRFRNLIAHLGTNRIVLLSTHIVSDVEHIADTILIMKAGQLIQQGRREEILEIVKDMVWECTLPTELANELCEKYPIINLRGEKDHTFLRLVSKESPYEFAMQVPATLEDLYLYYFSEVKENE